jgi:hypothetical protein
VTSSGIVDELLFVKISAVVDSANPGILVVFIESGSRYGISKSVLGVNDGVSMVVYAKNAVGLTYAGPGGPVKPDPPPLPEPT